MKKKEIKKKQKDSTSYKGTVEVGIVKNGKRYKRFTTNTGTIDLFKYLCGCLSGEINANYNTNLRPGCLRIYNGNNAVLSYGIPLESVEIVPHEETIGGTIDQLHSNCSVVFSFLIPGTAIYQQTIDSVKLTPISDSSAAGGNTIYYAEARFDDSITIKDMSTNVYVSWTLTIKNET